MNTSPQSNAASKGQFRNASSQSDKRKRIAPKAEKVMRTTVSLTAPASEIVDKFKAATGLSTSRAIEELILRSEPRKPRIKMVNGRAVFDLPLEAGSITTEELLRLEDEPW